MTPTMTEVAPHKHQHPCDCGCGCRSECCELECLVHPRFFCGQLLADQDLTALVDWIKNKTGLARYRHGWGVVCGLHVGCGPKGSVTVTPGYAMDCCGRDIVLCNEAVLDLTSCWQRPPSHCENGRYAPATPNPAQQGSFNFGAGFAVPREHVQVFDVFVRYAESQTDARTALARGGCGGAAGCEYTRVHEGYKLYCKPAEHCSDPDKQYVDDWEDEYRKELAVRIAAINELRATSGDRRRLEHVVDYLHQYPLSMFCYLRERLCDLLRSASPLPAGWDNDLYFWLLQDWRNTRFRTPCRGCGPDTGIRLARVWLWMRRDGQGNEVFTTLYVNAYPPFRRPLAQDTWPERPGYTNLARYIWSPVQSAVASLQQLGFTIDRQPIQPEQAPGRISQESLLVSPAFTPRLIVYSYADLCDVSRVVAFGGSAASPLMGDRVSALAADDPELDLTRVHGIKEEIAGRLKAAGIVNVRDLAAVKPEVVRAAVADMAVPPNENKLIKAAGARLAEINREG